MVHYLVPSGDSALLMVRRRFPHAEGNSWSRFTVLRADLASSRWEEVSSLAATRRCSSGGCARGPCGDDATRSATRSSSCRTTTRACRSGSRRAVGELTTTPPCTACLTGGSPTSYRVSRRMMRMAPCRRHGCSRPPRRRGRCVVEVQVNECLIFLD
jgi:hypothetical protein